MSIRFWAEKMLIGDGEFRQSQAIGRLIVQTRSDGWQLLGAVYIYQINYRLNSHNDSHNDST